MLKFKFGFMMCLAASTAFAETAKPKDPVNACVRPYATTQPDEVERELKPFFGGTNRERDNGCPTMNQAAKTVCVPLAGDRHIVYGNQMSKRKYDQCKGPKPAFKAPLTNKCQCHCRNSRAIVCWDAGLSDFTTHR